MKKTLNKLVLLTVFLLSLTLCLAACDNTNGDDKNINNDKTLVSVSAEGSPYQIYAGAFDDASVTVRLNYDDDTFDTLVLTENDLTDEYISLLNTPGTHTVEMLYRGFEISYTVVVKERYHKVTFLNYNDEVVKVVNYDLLSNALVTPPTAEEMYVEGYRFTGEFDKSFRNVTEDMTVKGIYVKTFTVEFYNGKNVLISSQKVDVGNDALAKLRSDFAHRLPAL